MWYASYPSLWYRLKYRLLCEWICIPCGCALFTLVVRARERNSREQGISSPLSPSAMEGFSIQSRTYGARARARARPSARAHSLWSEVMTCLPNADLSHTSTTTTITTLRVNMAGGRDGCGCTAAWRQIGRPRPRRTCEGLALKSRDVRGWRTGTAIIEAWFSGLPRPLLRDCQSSTISLKLCSNQNLQYAKGGELRGTSLGCRGRQGRHRAT